MFALPPSRREIELSNTARVALRAHRNVVRSFKALLKRASLPADTRLYDLRHTCATLLLNSNVHPKYVQELLGTLP
jgi:integrase